MVFVAVLIEVAVAAFVAWWIRRGWYDKPTVSQRLEGAGVKAGWGLFPVYMVPAIILLASGPLEMGTGNVILMACLVYIGAAGALFVAAFVVGVFERSRARKAMRLSGHPVRPFLRAPWKIASFTAVAAFFLFLGLVYVVFSYHMLVTKYESGSGFDEYMQGWLIGGGVGFWVVVALAYAIQKARIWKAERDYEELTSGIEDRLLEKTTGEKRHSSGRLKAGYRKP
ncbi:hypothetical protein ABH924_003265 [Arthrobacter sp. GAS37]|uniref:hypothetical protein n=1 Tax=Arthrobacter sp. GAS37 TaxID=3156261 RepID=UPI003836BBBA